MLGQRSDHLLHVLREPFSYAYTLPAFGEDAAAEHRPLGALRAIPISRRFVRRALQLVFFLWLRSSAATILSGRIGKSLMRMPPSALAMALPIAGATGGNAASPTPLAPEGPSGWGVSTKTE